MNKYEFNAMQAPPAPGKKRAPAADASPSPASARKLKIAVPPASKKADAPPEPAELGERGAPDAPAAPVVTVVTPEPPAPPARKAAAEDAAPTTRRTVAAAPHDGAKPNAMPAAGIIGQDAAVDGEFLAAELPVGDGTLSGGDEAGLVGLLLGDDDEKPNPAIPGVSDRVHYLAMAAISVFPGLRGGAKKRESTLRPVGRPASRSECERRCGSDGFCDPSSKFGCGGEHCG
jgi:hypothetical protein